MALHAWAEEKVNPLDDLAKVEEAKIKAERGDAKLQYEIGVIYEYGLRIAKDKVEAAKWYRKAAEQGDAGAQYCLGLLYVEGRGLPKNEAEGLKCWRKAAWVAPAGEGPVVRPLAAVRRRLFFPGDE